MERSRFPALVSLCGVCMSSDREQFRLKYLEFILDGYPDCDRPVYTRRVTIEEAIADLDRYNEQRRRALIVEPPDCSVEP